MKALSKSLFAADRGSLHAEPRVAYQRVSAAELQLPESWFRDAILYDPELVIGPCREAGRVPADERWTPWATEFSFGAGPVDVLLVSSRGRPAIVETKLSYNPEKRREVVAQILDYALALQDASLDELPPLPAGAVADDSDLHECLSTGKFALIVAGDALDARAVRLSEALLAAHLTSEWDLVMVDLNVYRSTGADAPLLIVPELRGVVRAETRQVVRVQVEGSTPRARVSVERIPSEDVSEDRRPRLASVEEFLDSVRRKSPAAAIPVSRIIARFQQVNGSTGGLFELGLQAATANLYCHFRDGVPRRVFALNESGGLRIWLRYVLKAGRDDVATRIRELAKPVVDIPVGAASGLVAVDQNNVESILSVIESVVTAIAKMEP
jgi:hypothetical protein